MTKYHNTDCNQCDQIGLFLKALGKIILNKVPQTFDDFGLFEKHNVLVKTDVCVFWKIWASFISTSGHTDYTLRPIHISAFSTCICSRWLLFCREIENFLYLHWHSPLRKTQTAVSSVNQPLGRPTSRKIKRFCFCLLVKNESWFVADRDRLKLFSALLWNKRTLPPKKRKSLDDNIETILYSKCLLS